MDYRKVILLVLLFSFPLGKNGGCFMSATPPLDDVYYWPGLEQNNTSFPPADSEAELIEIPEEKQPEEQSAEETPAPTLEFTNVQDTTITVVIKRNGE